MHLSRSIADGETFMDPQATVSPGNYETHKPARLQELVRHDERRALRQRNHQSEFGNVIQTYDMIKGTVSRCPRCPLN